MVEFFTTLKNSIYNPKFYSNIAKQSSFAALGYFLLLVTLLTLIRTATLFYPLYIQTPQSAKSFIESVKSYYPNELEVKINQGKVSSNVNEPYFILFPNSIDYFTGEIENILVIDTKTPFTASQFKDYSTIAWLASDNLFVKDKSSSFRAIDLSKIDNFTFNQQTLVFLIDKVKPWLGLIGPALLLMAFIGIFITYLVYFLWLLVIALGIMLITRLAGKKQGFSLSYKTSLYAVTLGFLVQLIIGTTKPWTGFAGFPLMGTLITLGVVYWNFKQVKKKG